jgi:hypothetical protein
MNLPKLPKGKERRKGFPFTLNVAEEIFGRFTKR